MKFVTHETYRPEEQVHQSKLHQIHKALETWISDHEYEGEWQIDVVAVRIVPRETYAMIKFIENLIMQMANNRIFMSKGHLSFKIMRLAGNALLHCQALVGAGESFLTETV